MAGFAFDTVGGTQLCAVCHPDNTASSRVMQRLGMRYRGTEFRYDMDCTVYSMTRAEWNVKMQGDPKKTT